jgi:hypothetical protein
LTDYIFLNPLDSPSPGVDDFFLDIVENCHIELENNDFMLEKSCSYQCNFNAKETSIIQKEIQKLFDINLGAEARPLDKQVN